METLVLLLTLLSLIISGLLIYILIRIKINFKILPTSAFYLDSTLSVFLATLLSVTFSYCSFLFIKEASLHYSALNPSEESNLAQAITNLDFSYLNKVYTNSDILKFLLKIVTIFFGSEIILAILIFVFNIDENLERRVYLKNRITKGESLFQKLNEVVTKVEQVKIDEDDFSFIISSDSKILNLTKDIESTLLFMIHQFNHYNRNKAALTSGKQYFSSTDFNDYFKSEIEISLKTMGRNLESIKESLGLNDNYFMPLDEYKKCYVIRILFSDLDSLFFSAKSLSPIFKESSENGVLNLWFPVEKKSKIDLQKWTKGINSQDFRPFLGKEVFEAFMLENSERGEAGDDFFKYTKKMMKKSRKHDFLAISKSKIHIGWKRNKFDKGDKIERFLMSLVLFVDMALSYNNLLPYSELSKLISESDNDRNKKLKKHLFNTVYYKS